MVPNHIDIIEFNSGDEENIEPEIFFENENPNNVFIKLNCYLKNIFKAKCSTRKSGKPHKPYGKSFSYYGSKKRKRK